MRTHSEPGIRRDAAGRIHAYVRAGGRLRFKRFPAGTSLESVRRWRLDTRAALRLTSPAAGSLDADIEPFLRQFVHRPRFVQERRRQLRWWADRFAHRSRHSLESAEIRIALAELRRSHAATTCNHYRQALYSLYRCLDGPDAPNPARGVPRFPVPEAEPRGLSYELVRRILDAMSDHGQPVGKGRPRAEGSKAKVRCRVMAFTGMRPSEIMRYRPEHWNRTDHVLTVPDRQRGSDPHDSADARGRSGFVRPRGARCSWALFDIHGASRFPSCPWKAWPPGDPPLRPAAQLRHRHVSGHRRDPYRQRVAGPLDHGDHRAVHARVRPGVHAGGRRAISAVDEPDRFAAVAGCCGADAGQVAERAQEKRGGQRRRPPASRVLAEAWSDDPNR